MAQAYYNEHDAKAAEWLRELIARDLIAPGDVDERSIEDVTPTELVGYTQHHFFAGIGIWSYALRLAGWPDDRPVWTGSCPCQPFSSAGKGGGFDDERHLWPSWLWLIRQSRPECVFGEQVAGSNGERWLDLVQDDVEGIGYAIGSVATAACGFGAPHIRKRLYWVAHDDRERLAERSERYREAVEPEKCSPSRNDVSRCRENGGMANDGSQGSRRNAGAIPSTQGQGECERVEPRSSAHEPESDGVSGCVGDANSERQETEQGFQSRIIRATSRDRDHLATPTAGFWRDPDWVLCRGIRDKPPTLRPVEPGPLALVDGPTSGVVRSGDISLSEAQETQEGRVMRLAGYGNAIVAQQAQAFIEAYIHSW